MLTGVNDGSNDPELSASVERVAELLHAISSNLTGKATRLMGTGNQDD